MPQRGRWWQLCLHRPFVLCLAGWLVSCVYQGGRGAYLLVGRRSTSTGKNHATSSLCVVQGYDLLCGQDASSSSCRHDFGSSLTFLTFLISDGEPLILVLITPTDHCQCISCALTRSSVVQWQGIRADESTRCNLDRHWSRL